MGIGFAAPARPLLSDAQILALGEATMARSLSCGHPKIAENLIALDGGPGVRCRVCANRAARA